MRGKGAGRTSSKSMKCEQDGKECRKAAGCSGGLKEGPRPTDLAIKPGTCRRRLAAISSRINRKDQNIWEENEKECLVCSK